MSNTPTTESVVDETQAGPNSADPLENLKTNFWHTIELLKSNGMVITSELTKNIETLLEQTRPKTEQLTQTTRALGEAVEQSFSTLKDRTFELVNGQKPLTSVFVTALGVAQDGGYPQIGCALPCCQNSSSPKYVASLAVVDVLTSERWIIDATQNFSEQLRYLEHLQAPDTRFFSASAINNSTEPKSFLSGVLLTHSQPGHISGLLQLGKEAANLKGVKVYCLPRLADFIRKNPPFSKLVEQGNIVLTELKDQEKVSLNWRISVTPITVPYQDEFSETVGYLIEGPEKSVVYIPDVDNWDVDSPNVSLTPSAGTLLRKQASDVAAANLDEGNKPQPATAKAAPAKGSAIKAAVSKSASKGVPTTPKKEEPAEEPKKKCTLEELILRVDFALLDGTFFSTDELSSGVIPDATQAPHPSVQETAEYLRRLPNEDKQKVHFVHFNHTNPCLWDGNNFAKNFVNDKGHRIVSQGQKFYL